MSATYYCDCCGYKMKPHEHKRVIMVLDALEVEVMHTYKGSSNSGNICHRCIKKAVKHGMPKVKP